MGGADKLGGAHRGPVGAALGRRVAGCRAGDGADIIVVVPLTARRSFARRIWLRRLRSARRQRRARRQDSVAAGVRDGRADIVLVHDAARPFVSPALVRARRGGRPAPRCGHPRAARRRRPQDASRTARITGAASGTGLYRAQTPQAARRDLLLAAAEAHAAGAGGPARRGRAAGPRTVWQSTSWTGEADQHQGHAAGGPARWPVAWSAERPGRAWPWVPTATPSARGDGLRLGGLLIDARHSSTATRTVTSSCMRSATACWRPPDRVTSGRLFPSGEPGTRGVDSRALVTEVMTRLAQVGLRRGQSGRHHPRRAPATLADDDWTTWPPPSRVTDGRAAGSRLGQGHRPATSAGDEGAGRAISATCLVSLGVPMSLRFRNTLGWSTGGLRAARAGSCAHVQLRADRLRPGPRGQLPLVRLRRPRAPGAALRGPARDLGHEHHRRGRQDHP